MNPLTILTLITMLLLPINATARMSAVMVGGGVEAAGITDDSCTGGLLFSWHCETTTVTETDTPKTVAAGCVVSGDTGGTAVSSATLDTVVYKDGVKSCDFPSSSDRYDFDVSSEDIVKHADGHFDFWLYMETFAANATVMGAYADSNNYIRVVMSGTNQLKMIDTSGGTNRASGETTFDTGGGGLQTSEWYHVKAAWDQDKASDGNNYLKICVDITDGTANCGVGTSAPGTWNGTMATLRIGEAAGSASDFHLDLIKVYSSWPF